MPISVAKVKKRGVQCLWCGENLPLFKRMAKSDFCSDDHSIKYYNEWQGIMLERLRSSLQRLDALKPRTADKYQMTA